jgi:hypothetical protein
MNDVAILFEGILLCKFLNFGREIQTLVDYSLNALFQFIRTIPQYS